MRSNVRILYITGLWSGLKDLLVSGDGEPKGMPAFFKPLEAFLAEGIQLEMAIEHPQGTSFLMPKSGILGSVKIHKVDSDVSSKIKKLTTLLTTVGRLRRIIREGNYDFVYCHGYWGSMGVTAAILEGVKCGQRVYGTFLYDMLKSVGRVRTAIRKPLEYAAFRQRKKFLIVTNDGTRGDKVQDWIGADSYQFYYPRNGISISPPSPSQLDESCNEISRILDGIEGSFMLYPGRTDRWKRQDHGVRILAECHRMGDRKMHLVFVGHNYDDAWRKEFMKLAEDLGVGSYCHFVGPISRTSLLRLYREAVAVLSFYDNGNIGNVMIEALYCGAFLATYDDETTRELIDSGSNGVLVKAPCDVASFLVDSKREYRERNRENARARARRDFLTWEERCRFEINLVLEAAGVVETCPEGLRESGTE